MPSLNSIHFLIRCCVYAAVGIGISIDDPGYVFTECRIAVAVLGAALFVDLDHAGHLTQVSEARARIDVVASGPAARRQLDDRTAPAASMSRQVIFRYR